MFINFWRTNFRKPDVKHFMEKKFWSNVPSDWQTYSCEPIYTFNDSLQKTFLSDAPFDWQMHLHDPASISMEGILTFNNHLLFLVIVIVMFVGWLIAFTVYYFVEYHNKFSSKFVHSKELEIVWTSIPALILLLLATPSFTLLYDFVERL